MSQEYFPETDEQEAAAYESFVAAQYEYESQPAYLDGFSAGYKQAVAEVAERQITTRTETRRAGHFWIPQMATDGGF